MVKCYTKKRSAENGGGNYTTCIGFQKGGKSKVKSKVKSKAKPIKKILPKIKDKRKLKNKSTIKPKITKVKPKVKPVKKILSKITDKRKLKNKSTIKPKITRARDYKDASIIKRIKNSKIMSSDEKGTLRKADPRIYYDGRKLHYGGGMKQFYTVDRREDGITKTRGRTPKGSGGAFRAGGWKNGRRILLRYQALLEGIRMTGSKKNWKKAYPLLKEVNKHLETLTTAGYGGRYGAKIKKDYNKHLAAAYREGDDHATGTRGSLLPAGHSWNKARTTPLLNIGPLDFDFYQERFAEFPEEDWL